MPIVLRSEWSAIRNLGLAAGTPREQLGFIFSRASPADGIEMLSSSAWFLQHGTASA